MDKKLTYDNLDGLRAFAAIGIVIMHVYANMPHLCYKGLVHEVICSFAELTLLFFMISAFSLCCGYYERFRSRNIDINNFYLRRFSRILPFFALMSFIDIASKPSWDSVLEGLTNISMVFGLLPNPDIKVIGVGWFIGVIFVFYLLFPFFIYLISSKRKAIMSMLASVLLFLIVSNYWMTDEYILAPLGKRNILYVAPFFLAGGCVFLYKKSITRFVSDHQILSYLSVILISNLIFVIDETINEFGGICIGFIDISHEFAPRGVFNLAISHKVIILGLWICLALGPVSKLLSNKLTKFLSNISMEIYLCHMMGFRVVENLGLFGMIEDEVICYWITCVATLLFAIAFSYGIKYKVFPITRKILCFFYYFLCFQLRIKIISIYKDCLHK